MFLFCGGVYSVANFPEENIYYETEVCGEDAGAKQSASQWIELPKNFARSDQSWKEWEMIR